MNERTSRLPDPCDVGRRTFLKAGLAAATAAAAGTAACEPRPPAIPAAGGPAIPPFELDEAALDDLQRLMSSGEETSESLVGKYIGRIESLDRQGPSLRQVLELNPDAASIAAGLDAERRAGRTRGPLHGIPILIKDNVATADRMTTTAGSLALEGTVAGADAAVAARLRDAGAVLLGKTNMSEWANFRSTHSTSGWSGRGGQGRNPYALDRNTSGSSSGTGGAIAAGYAAAGIGTETDGSIVSPSNCCGLVGIKPTIGLVSRAGIIPIAHSQDTAGPMTRTVRDAAILLGVLAAPDPADEATREGEGHRHADYTTFLDPDGLRGARIGVVRKTLTGYSSHADRIVEESIDVLRRLGAVVVDPADIMTVDDLTDPEFEVLLYEFKAGLNRFLAGLGPSAPIHSLEDAIRFNEQNRSREMPYFGQQVFEMAQAKGPLTDTAYLDALAACRRLSRRDGIDAVMNANSLDALFAPTGAPAPLIDLVNGDHYPGGSSTVPAVAGYPHITVPGGFARGLPVGVSFFGRAFSEPVLIRFAYAFEQATTHRRPPAFAPTADLGG